MVIPFGKRHSSTAPVSANPSVGAKGQRPLSLTYLTEVNLPGQFHRYWWSFDAARRTFRHIASGEEVRFIGPLEPLPGSGGQRPWFRFDYVCAEARFPLAVQFKRVSTAVPTEEDLVEVLQRARKKFDIKNLRARSWRKESQAWLVDYRRSAKLWSEEAGGANEIPPYGLWRRADEAFIGAALTWPCVEVEGPSCDEVAARGGWLNGEWRENVYRRVRRDWTDGPERQVFYPFEADGCVKAWLWPRFHDASEYTPIPLDEAPTQWSFELRPVKIETERFTFTTRTVPTAFDPRTGAMFHLGNLWTYTQDHRAENLGDPHPTSTLLFEGFGCYFHVALDPREMTLRDEQDPNPMSSVGNYSNLLAVVDEDAFENRFGPLSRNQLKYRPGAGKYLCYSLWNKDYAKYWNCPLLEGPLHNYNYARYLRIAMLDVLSISTGFSDPGSSGGLTFTEAGTVEVLSNVAGMSNCNYFLRTAVDPLERGDLWSWRGVFED